MLYCVKKNAIDKNSIKLNNTIWLEDTCLSLCVCLYVYERSLAQSQSLILFQKLYPSFYISVFVCLSLCVSRLPPLWVLTMRLYLGGQLLRRRQNMTTLWHHDRCKSRQWRPISHWCRRYHVNGSSARTVRVRHGACEQNENETPKNRVKTTQFRDREIIEKVYYDLAYLWR